MELRKQFETVMNESVNMALSTSVNNLPNVRIVTFAYDANKQGKVFFTTFKGNKKIEEFSKNPHVACMPLPQEPEAQVQVRIFGKVQKSDISLDEVIDIVSKKYTGGADTLKMGGDQMEIYEVCFSQAYVTVCMAPAQIVQL